MLCMKRLCGLDDLTVAIVAAIRAYTMRKLHFAALRAYRARRCCNLIVFGTTCVGTSTTSLTLWHCHDCFSFYDAGSNLKYHNYAKRYPSKGILPLQAPLVIEADILQNCKWVCIEFIVFGRIARAFLGVQVGTASRADALAVITAQRRIRNRQGKRRY